MRHIPLSPTTEQKILTFSEALETVSETAYDRSHWLYVPDHYSEYRYILGTRGSNPLICIGINPSTAAPDRLDNTLKSVERIAHFNGFDSFLMMNVYAQRATDPDDMEPDLNEKLHAENLKAFSYLLSLCPGIPSVWAAWGTLIEKREYLAGCVSDMALLGKKRGVQWYTAGKRSKAGHPHHPLYLSATSSLEAFDPDDYLMSLHNR